MELIVESGLKNEMNFAKQENFRMWQSARLR